MSEVCDRVHKLVLLATNNPSGHEAERAAMKACRLIVDNNLSVQDSGGAYSGIGTTVNVRTPSWYDADVSGACPRCGKSTVYLPLADSFACTRCAKVYRRYEM